MKRIRISILFFLLLHKVCFSQISFERWYPVYAKIGVLCLSDENGGYLIGVQGGNNNLIPSTESIVHINNFGDTLWSAQVNFPDRSFFGKLALSPEGNYIGIGTVYNVNGDFDTWVMRVDSSNGNVISQFIVATSVFSGGAGNITGLQFLANKHLMISSAYPGSIIIICDSTGNITKSSNFGPAYPYAGNLFKYDNNFLVLTYEPYPIPIYNQCRALIINDSLDTISSVKLKTDSVHSTFSNSFLLPGKRILSSGSYGNYMHYGLGVSLNDSLGNLLVEKRTSINRPPSSNVFVPRITATISGGFYYGGYITLPGNNYPVAFNTKYDSQFDSVWTRYYGDSVDTRLYDMFSLPDETFFGVGNQIRNNWNQAGVYYLKTDTAGNVSTYFPQIKKEQSYLHLYPNPANSYTSLHYIGQEKASLQITKLTGEVVYKKLLESSDDRELINTGDYASGTYICSILNAEGKVLITKNLIVVK